MPLANFNKVREGLITHISRVVGNQLSQLPTEDPSVFIPAVIRDREKGPTPDFPYIMVSNAEVAKTDGSWLRSEDIVEVDGEFKISYKSEQTLTVEITCYGDEADHILNHLRVASNDSVTRSSLNGLTEATFQTYSDSNRNPTFRETDFLETSSMQVTFVLISEWIPPESSFIETVKGEGNYYSDHLDDSEPVLSVPLNIDLTNP